MLSLFEEFLLESGAFVVGLAGQVPLLAGPVLRSCFDVLMPIGNRAMSVPDAMNCTGANLRRAALDLGNLLALRSRA